jgi:hypothetical protein
LCGAKRITRPEDQLTKIGEEDEPLKRRRLHVAAFNQDEVR